MSNQVLKIFVAMPGTDMGPEARWRSPDRIKVRFFEEIGKKLEEHLQSKVNLIVEKDREQSGVIYTSMFKEAMEADVYIADITGNNPNVYLELGVRWALKDKVTIVVRQEDSPVKFNVAANRIFQYSNDPDILSSAIEKIVRAIEAGIKDSGTIDSPVRQNTKIVAYSKEDIKRLEDENKLLKSLQGRDYLIAGRSSNDPEYRLLMFRKAVETNGALLEGYFDLAIELRKLGKYDEAIPVLRRANSLDPNSVQIHRELGLMYSKMENFEDAIPPLREAVRLDPKDAEAWNILGGVLRRVGMQKLLKDNDWSTLREARTSYSAAFSSDDRSTYALGNLARLDLILSKDEPMRKFDAIKEFEMLRHLCSFMLIKAPDDYWLSFDLADTYLLTGEVDEGYRLYQKAVQLMPQVYQASVLSSVISPLEEFISIGVVEDPIRTVTHKVIGELKQVSSN